MRHLTALLLLLAPQAGGGTVTGELRKWHRVTVTFDGPSTSEGATPNPFRDYRLNVTFTKGARSIVVPGFWAADGNAAETSATSGGKWRVHFAPDEEGTWAYSASFRTGTDLAASSDPNAGSGTSFDGASGGFTIGATDKTGRDHRGKGRLRHVGGHQLRFAQTGEAFLKGGADSPENFLAYGDFDQTTAKHAYAPHAGDWQAGDPVWKASKGKNILGALNYLSGKGMNSVYFLTMNVAGDGNDVWPWTSSGERHRFDASKLDQWEIVFSHMDRKGLMLHVVTQETENDQLLDGGSLGLQRKLYYRELVARFGHHLAVVWNLGEENTNTDAQRKSFADFLRQLDPYDSPVVVHTYPGQYDSVYTPLLGHPSFEGPSLQMGGANQTHAETVKWVQRSASNGRKWFVSLDEIGPANDGVLTDAEDFDHDNPRKNALWGNLMGGGAGCEWYFGYGHPHTDLTCEDWRSRDNMWNQTRHALQFFQQNVPFADSVPSDPLTSNGWCLAKADDTYVVYLPNGGSANVQLPAGTFSLRWYNPRAGGALQNGSVTSVTGGGSVSIGTAPSEPTKDWAVLLKKTGGGGTPPPPTDQSVTAFILVNADTDLDLGPLTSGATLNLATLPTRNLNVRAVTNPGLVGSVRFGLDGNSDYRTESTAPYALAGDTNGDYAPWTPAVGAHTLTATPYTGSGATGTAGTGLTVAFSVIDQADPVNQPPAVSAGPDLSVTLPASAALDGTATDTDPLTTAWSKVSGPGTVAFGNAAAPDTTAAFSSAGTYVLRLTASDGTLSASDDVQVTVSSAPTGGQAVLSLTLIDADTDQPLAGFDPLGGGAVLNLGTLPTRNLNLRANTNPATVGSVVFGLDGIADYRVESTAPYALAGDTTGDYHAWTPAVGSRSVTATPWTLAGGSGAAGASLMLAFTVIDDPSTPSTNGSAGGGPAPLAASGGGSGGGCGLTGLEALLLLGLLRLRRPALLLALPFLLAARPLAGVYQESGGIVVVEIEAEPAGGSWTPGTALAGYTGSGYYTWTGPDLFNSPGSGVLRYEFNLTTPGTYQLRIRNRHDFADSTEQNDCFTRMDGGAWVKTFSSQRGQWTWATNHEFDANTKPPAAYALSAGLHVLEISGRSHGFSIDRFHLYLDSTANPLDATRPPSSTSGATTPPPPGGQAVTGLTLIDADVDQPVPGFDPLADGAVLNLATLPTRNLNLRANTDPATVGSVVFGLDGAAAYRTESGAPYALAGDSAGDYAAWTPSVGPHSATATPYASAGGTGAAGTSLTRTFSVIDQPGTPSTNGGAAGPGSDRENENGDHCILGTIGRPAAGIWAFALIPFLLRRRR
jgi:hypothetical protein